MPDSFDPTADAAQIGGAAEGTSGFASAADRPDADGWSRDDMVRTAATIGVVAVGAALIEVSLIPGLVIGVAASFAPRYLPRLGNGMHPMVKSAVRGAYKFGRKTREAVAEAHEQVQDIVAEVRAEDGAPEADSGSRPHSDR